jgi:glycine cleavage system regulatory protein
LEVTTSSSGGRGGGLRFTQELQDQQTSEGATVKVCAKVAVAEASGTPDLMPQWKKDNSEQFYYSTQHIQMSQSSGIEEFCLTINGVKADDAGSYELQVQDGKTGETIKSQCSVTVDSTSTTAFSSTPTTPSTPMMNDQSSSPHTTPMNQMDQVSASSNAPSLSDTSPNPNEPTTSPLPFIFVTPLDDQKVEESQPVKMFVRIKGESINDLRAQWMKDGQNIDANSHYQMSEDSSNSEFTLEIPSAQLDDTGTYEVKVSAQDGQDITSQCQLIVHSGTTTSSMSTLTTPTSEMSPSSLHTTMSPQSTHPGEQMTSPSQFETTPTPNPNEPTTSPLPFIFVTPLDDQKVEESQPVKMFVRIKGESINDLREQWMKDGQNIDANSHYQMSKDSSNSEFTLEIPSAQLDDTGTYEVKLSAQDGQDITSQCQLIVHSGTTTPSMSSTPKTPETSSPSNIQTTMSPPNNESPTTSANNNENNMQESPTPSPPNNNNNDNESPPSSTPKPGQISFTQQLQDQTAKPGDKVKLCAKVTGASANDLTSQWKKDGSETFFYSTQHIQLEQNDGEDEFCLTINGMEPTDQGKYEVEVQEQQSGQLITSQCQVTLEGASTTPSSSQQENTTPTPPASNTEGSNSEPTTSKPGGISFTKPLEDQTVREGENVRMCATVSGASAKDLTSQWKKDKSETFFYSTQHIQLEQNDNADEFCMQINGAKQSDAGNYEVEIQDSQGQLITSQCQVRIEDVSTTTTTPETTPTTPSTPMSSEPTPESSSSPQPSARQQSSQTTPTTPEPHSEQTPANYQKQTTPESSTQSNANQHESTSPSTPSSTSPMNPIEQRSTTSSYSISFEVALSDQTVQESQPITLRVKIQGEGVNNLKAQWIKDGQELSTNPRMKQSDDTSSNEFLLEIPSAHPEDTGTYDVKVSSQNGQSIETTCQVIVGESTTHPTTEPTPESTPSTPESTPSTPESTPSTPESTPSTPESTRSTPESTRSTPESSPSTPESTRSTPESTPSTPESTRSTPSSSPSTPTSASTPSNVFSFMSPLPDHILHESEPLKMSVKVQGGNSGSFKTQWLKDGKAISGKSRIQTSEDPSTNELTLEIPSSEVSDAGFYQVKVTSDSGKTITSTCQVTVTGSTTLSTPSTPTTTFISTTTSKSSTTQSSSTTTTTSTTPTTSTTTPTTSIKLGFSVSLDGQEQRVPVVSILFLYH